MKGLTRKITHLLLALALIVMPVKIAFADNYNPADTSQRVGIPLHDTASPTIPFPHNNQQAMSDGPCNPPCDMPNDKSTGNTTPHCSSGAHCCMAVLGVIHDATPISPYTPRVTFTVTLTSIIIPTATKPPRHTLLG